MIPIIIRSKDQSVVDKKKLYTACVGDIKLNDIRAKSVREAELKMMYVFRHELTGKTLDFNLEDFPDIT